MRRPNCVRNRRLVRFDEHLLSRWPRTWPGHGRWAALAILLCALSLSTALAIRDGAVYAGAMPDGSMVFMQIEVAPDGSAFLRVRGEPVATARPERPHFDAAADPEWSSAALILTTATDDWAGGAVGPASGPDGSAAAGRARADVRVWAALHQHDRTLDPFGFAALTIAPTDGTAPVEVRMAAVGTMYQSRFELVDGSFAVSRTAPMFYDATWLGLDLIAAVAGDMQTARIDGLRLRRESPSGPTARWADEREADVMSLGGNVASVLYRHYSYTGGAHPNTFRTSETYLRTAAGWSRAGLCEALAAIGAACDRRDFRDRVIRDLEEQEAAWVVAGDVHADTPWLLDTFTLTTAAVRFDFSPYQVGPYASGPFTVTVPYASIR